jgi:L-lactate permease
MFYLKPSHHLSVILIALHGLTIGLVLLSTEWFLGLRLFLIISCIVSFFYHLKRVRLTHSDAIISIRKLSQNQWMLCTREKSDTGSLVNHAETSFYLILNFKVLTRKINVVIWRDVLPPLEFKKLKIALREVVKDKT